MLQHPGGGIGAVAGHHHRLVGIEQKRGGDVLAGQGREGHRIGPQRPEEVVGQGRGAVQIAVFGVNDQRDLQRHQLSHLPQQIQAHGPKRLVEAEAGLVGADVGCGGLDHRLDPVAGLGEEGATGHAAALGPALQHLRVGVEPRHQQRLVVGDGVCEPDEESQAWTDRWLGASPALAPAARRRHSSY